MPKPPILRILLPLICIRSVYSKITPTTQQNEYGGSAQKVQLSDAEVMSMYQSWVDTGLSSIMAAVANKKLKKHRSDVADRFGECSKIAKDIPKHAKCVSRLINGDFQPKVVRNHIPIRAQRPSRLNRYGQKDPNVWKGAFRIRSKRSNRLKALSAKHYDLHSTSGNNGLSPLGGVAKLILQSVMTKRNKTRVPEWHDTIRRLKSAKERRDQAKRKLRDDSEESMDKMTYRAFRQHFPSNAVSDDLDRVAEDPKAFQRFLKMQEKRKDKKPEEKIVDLVRDGIKLGYSLAGQNTTDFDNRTMKLISPRFFGVVPEEKSDNEIDLLSPSLLSLHNEGVGLEKEASMGALLKGMSTKDRQMWMNLIMETAGVNEAADNVEKTINDEHKPKDPRKFFNPESIMNEDGKPAYFTKENATAIGGAFEERKIDVFETLHMSYSKQQLREMNSTGLAFLSPQQLHILYGPHSPYSSPKDLKRFLSIQPDEHHEHLERDIHSLSTLEKFNIRQKDIILSPISFTFLTLVATLASQPIILSPIIFSPLILSPSVFGAVIVSPWMFVPLVLSPRLLGSLIVSPFIMSPIILTPLALHPVILSPGIFNPTILSPLLLAPLILSPQVFTPIILSPLCLTPVILNPLVGSPLILSPYVLSPIILSPMALSALVLSPYALSPVILSPLIAFAAILSPSWLS